MRKKKRRNQTKTKNQKMINIIKKIKERYDWKGYWKSLIVACILAIGLHMKQFKIIKIEFLLFEFLIVGVLMIIFMIGVSELIK